MIGLILFMGAVIVFLSYLVWGRKDVHYQFREYLKELRMTRGKHGV